jgi:hypothetical protein
MGRALVGFGWEGRKIDGLDSAQSKEGFLFFVKTFSLLYFQNLLQT